MSIEIGTRVRHRIRRGQKARIVVGVWNGFVYVVKDGNPWEADAVMVEDFWEIFEEA